MTKAAKPRLLLPTLATLCALLANVNCESALLEITEIQLTNAAEYLSVNSTIYNNRTQFDVNFTVHRELPNHELSLKMTLKLRPERKDHYITLYKWKRINLCKYLLTFEEDQYFKYLFKSTTQISSVIRCPIRRGNYELRNFSLEQNFMQGTFPVGSYRLFMEIGQMSGELLKLFGMQITAVYSG